MQPSKFKETIAPLMCVTPISKYLALTLFILLPFIGFMLGTLYAQQTPLQTVYIPMPNKPEMKQPTSENTLPQSDMKFVTYVDHVQNSEVQVPESWNLTESQVGEDGVGSNEYVSGCTEGATSTVGVHFSIQDPQVISSIDSPDDFRKFHVLGQVPGNAVSDKEITLAGEVAFLTQAPVGCGMTDQREVPAYTIQTVHNGKMYTVIFFYDSMTPENQTILDTFIRTFKFTE